MAYTTVTKCETEERAHNETLLLTERRSLEMIAGGARLSDILTGICDAIDAQDPGIISTIQPRQRAAADRLRLLRRAGGDRR
jgi:hypothetical protein